MNKSTLYLSVLLLAASLPSCQGPSNTPVQANTITAARNKDMITAVNSFLQTLTPAQKQQVQYAFDAEERFNWFFVPIERKGLTMRDMNAEQKQAAITLLRTAMSDQGYEKAKAIMEMEVVLKALEKLPPENDRRHPEKYYFTLFGTPSAAEPWGWRMEGHHLSLNFTSVTGEVVAGTPAFMGSNPGIVPEGPQQGRQILKQEADLGFALLHTFSPEQRKKVLIAEVAPNEIVTTNKRKAMVDRFEGIPYPEMTAPQKALFQRLLNVYLDNYRPALAQGLRQKMEAAGIDKAYFAWAGHDQPVIGKAHYYRIHHPVLLIEYDNSQNNANHVHTVVRDISNDFGEDALAKHYQQHPHQK